MKKINKIKKFLVIFLPLLITFLVYIVFSNQLFKSSIYFSHSDLELKFYKIMSDYDYSSDEIKIKNNEINQAIKSLLMCIQYPEKKFSFKRNVLESISMEGGFFLESNHIDKVIINYKFNKLDSEPEKIVYGKIENCLDNNVEFKIFNNQIGFFNWKKLIIDEFVPQKNKFNFFDILSGVFSTIIFSLIIYRII